MIIRLRSRDGLERIEVGDTLSVAALQAAINAKLGIPLEGLVLSKQPALLTSKDPSEFRDLANPSASLKAAGVSHGDMVFMLYSVERDVAPLVKKGLGAGRTFGEHITVRDVMAKQRRIERQDKPVIESVSFEREAAHVFQLYVQSYLAFSIKRGGILYGTVEDKNVKVEFVYEPPQEGTAEHLILQRDTAEAKQVDLLAGMLGLQKVGWVFNQSKAARDTIMSNSEVMQMAAIQDEIGPTCVTVVASFDPNEAGGHVHLEAFQASEQCVILAKEGWLVDGGPGISGVTKIRNPNEQVDLPAIVAGQDAAEVDNDWFLCPVKILSHEGRIGSSFPVENRLLPQGKTELREHLKRHASRAYVERLSDLHLLLWLSKQPNLDAQDLQLLCTAVKDQMPVLEGYRVIIDSIAGLQ